MKIKVYSMKSYTPEELCDMIEKSDKVNDAQKTSSTNPTRLGHYINIQKGLSSKTIFIGTDLENNRKVIELVG